MLDTHVLDLLRREQAKLDLLDAAQRRARVREVEVRHRGRLLEAAKLALSEEILRANKWQKPVEKGVLTERRLREVRTAG